MRCSPVFGRLRTLHLLYSLACRAMDISPSRQSGSSCWLHFLMRLKSGFSPIALVTLLQVCLDGLVVIAAPAAQARHPVGVDGGLHAQCLSEHDVVI